MIDDSTARAQSRPLRLSHTRIVALGAFVVALGLVLLLQGTPRVSMARQEAGASTDGQFRSVRLVIFYGDDVEKHYNLLRWTKGMTVLDALNLAHGKPEPLGLAFLAVGKGDRAFVRSIEGLANEGGRPGARNWVYRINDHEGDRSCGVALLQPGDTVSWLYLPILPAKAEAHEPTPQHAPEHQP